jgi:hypothetical protein
LLLLPLLPQNPAMCSVHIWLLLTWYSSHKGCTDHHAVNCFLMASASSNAPKHQLPIWNVFTPVYNCCIWNMCATDWCAKPCPHLEIGC